MNLFDFFINLSSTWILLGLFTIVFVDAIVIPLGPEFFAIVVYMLNRTFEWGVTVLITVCLAQILGTSFLYFIGNFFPKWAKKLMRKYSEILFIKGEKIILLNCFVPLLPFLGAFIRVCEWDLKISLAFVAIGGLIKYSILMILCSWFYYLFSEGVAQIVTIGTALCVIVISMIISYRVRKYKWFNIKTILRK